MNKLLPTLLLALAWAAPAAAQHDHAHAAASGPMQMAPGGIAQSRQLVEGEVRKVDTAARRVTIHHGEIKNLGMPAMTMVFQVKDPTLIAQVKEGDKVRFRAEMDGGAMVVTVLEAAK